MEALDVIATMIGAAIGTGRNGGYVLFVFATLAVLVLLVLLRAKRLPPPPLPPRPLLPDEMDDPQLNAWHLDGLVKMKQAELVRLKRELAEARRAAIPKKPPPEDLP